MRLAGANGLPSRHRPTPRSNLGLCDQSSQLPDQYSRYRVSLGCFCSYRSLRLVKVGGMICLGEESSLDCQNRGDGGIASHHAEQEDTVLLGPEARFTWRTDYGGRAVDTGSRGCQQSVAIEIPSVTTGSVTSWPATYAVMFWAASEICVRRSIRQTNKWVLTAGKTAWRSLGAGWHDIIGI